MADLLFEFREFMEFDKSLKHELQGYSLELRTKIPRKHVNLFRLFHTPADFNE